jgi:hypothetical protein
MGRLASLLLASLLLPGCGGSFTVDADGVDGFSPASQVWQLLTTSSANRHSFVLTNTAGYCAKQQKSQQDITDANARHNQRLADADPICESTDQWYDDLADAAEDIERDGAAYFRISIAREGETNTDAITAPEAGEYRQVGAGDDKFDAQYVRYNGKLSRLRADAYNCLNPEDLDETNFQEFLAEVEPGLLDFWSLDAGILELETSGDDAWSIDVSGDLLEGSSSIGSLAATFTGSRCEVPVDQDTLDAE